MVISLPKFSPRAALYALFVAMLANIAIVTDAAASPTASELLAVTENCSPLPGLKKFKADASTATSDIQLCKHKNVIWFKADLDIDCDGGSSQACKADRSYQPETSCVSSSGKFLDASSLPFFVLPLNSNGFSPSEFGITCGSIGAIIYKDRVEYAIMGDRGPKGVIGEASYALAKRLGINPDPNSGGVSSGVTYIVFTGREAVLSPPIDSHARAISLGESLSNVLIGGQIHKLLIQNPSSGQAFSARERISFTGRATANISQVRLIADSKWEIGISKPVHESWSISTSLVNSGVRKIQAIGFNNNGQQVTSDTLEIRIGNNPISDVKVQTVIIATEQWNEFGRQTMVNDALVHKGHAEGEEGYWQRVVKYWKDGVSIQNINTRAQVMSDTNPWSAAFISYVMKKSGAGIDFKYSPAHSTYIRDAIANGLSRISNAKFVGHRISEYQPKPGDLICAPRAEAVGQVTFENAVRFGPFKSHCDIVVDVRDLEIDVIGGNVSNSVTRNTVKTVDGKIVAGPDRKWFVVIENRLN